MSYRMYNYRNSSNIILYNFTLYHCTIARQSESSTLMREQKGVSTSITVEFVCIHNFISFPPTQ